MKNNPITCQTNSRFTDIQMKLLHWMSHLELSGSYAGEWDIGQELSMPAMTSSMNELKETKNQTKIFIT